MTSEGTVVTAEELQELQQQNADFLADLVTPQLKPLWMVKELRQFISIKPIKNGRLV